MLAVLLSSCAASRIHYFGETPGRPGRYPVFTSRDSAKGYLDRYRSCYDVTSYDLDINLDPVRKRLAGSVLIRFMAVDTSGVIRFDLYRNLNINDVSIDGVPLTFRRDGIAVFVVLPSLLEPGKNYSLKVEYEGSPRKAVKPPWKGGFVWKKDKEGHPWIGVTCESEGSSIWFPCKDHLSDEPDSVRLKITVPEGLKVVSNGLQTGHSSLNGKEVYTWSTHYPINIYNITFYAGNFAEIKDTMQTGSGVLHLGYWVLPENLEKARSHFLQVKDVLRTYSRAFGPYPWIKEGFKLVESPYEGMEHQTAIAYGSEYQNVPWLGGDYIIVHESAHEWWGNAVSVSDFSDIWLQEGFATYSEVVFAECKKGYEASLNYLFYWLASGIKNKYPVVGPPNVSYWDYRDGDVYTKGALILNTIRNVINDSTLFFDILQTFYREHAAGTHVTTACFREILERKTGRNWEKFFEAYLYSRQVPELEWFFGTWTDPDSVTQGPVSFVAAKWKNVPDGFSMPVTLTCKQSGVSRTIEVTTVAKLYYLNNFTTCEQLNCNSRHSYFSATSRRELVNEAVPEDTDLRTPDVIAGF